MKPYIATIGIDRKLFEVLRGLRFFILRARKFFVQIRYICATVR